MKKRKYNPDQLEDFIHTVSHIRCTRCAEENSIEGDYTDASEGFFTKGWRVTQSNAYCPNCAKKKIKDQ